METRNLKDVIHLYLGCPIRFHSNLTGTWGIWNKMTCSDIEIATDHIRFGEKCQLLLRPLSDMTEDDANKMGVWADWHDNKKFGEDWGSWNPEQFIELLKNHFDLFSLIDSELAIDATTLNTNTK